MSDIAFIGAGPWGAVLLEALAFQPDIQVRFVLTDRCETFDRVPSIRDRSVVSYFVSDRAYTPILDRPPDAIVMAGWRRKIPSWVINALVVPFVNVHASLLPEFRGPDPIVRQLLHHAAKGGVSIHRVAEGWDSGPVCVQNEFRIEPADTNRSLFVKASRGAIHALRVFIERLQRNTLCYTPQDEQKGSYYGRIRVHDWIIHEAMSVDDVVTIAKAFAGQYPLLARRNGCLVHVLDFTFAAPGNTRHESITLRDGRLVIRKCTTWRPGPAM